ncbi:hypothetical protein PYW07_002855 [Mythimna separata]|uniref:PWWP domain-containing protein n=1 Tax=Mythimna separata TaxID=271217 RepID=A0AAD7YG30_MYTSE|nr:hypothetical protein PYW07_002855 [Mythimna separata]
MCENSEVSYLDGEVVWVKLGSCFWPGEVVGPEKLPPDVLPSFRKPPIAVVKFFQEDTYEYVKNASSIFKYNCSRKNEFINKGLYAFRTKRIHMEKFPEDVIRAETAIGGDIEILTREEFQEKKKESYAGIFGDPQKKTPGSGKKGRPGKSGESSRISTPFRKGSEKADYKVHILLQGNKPSTDNGSTETKAPTPSTSAEPDNTEEVRLSTEEKQETIDEPVPSCSTPTASTSAASTPVSSSGPRIYSCHACPFTTVRLNVLILHSKTHSVSFTPYTPSPVRKKVVTKTVTKSTPETPNKTPKARKPREKKEKVVKEVKEPKKTTPETNKKRPSESENNHTETKKVKTDEEIKSSLLADWDDGDEESNDESSTTIMAGSPEVPEATESPAVPTSAELSSVPLPPELSSPTEKKSNSSPTSEKPESSDHDSKYEFCEDEDWPLEADGGRKIPRVKNPKRKEDTKSISLDDDDMAREVAELLNKTTVPELPSAPEPLKVEENFPEPSIVKSPDKQEKSPEKSDKPPETPPTKAIFKTKTFFRSRHSRSQDAIGKYVAEQLNANAVERMDISESEINGSEVVSSPEARESPPIEHVKVARLAPKIQLKKMKAELREKSNFENFGDITDFSNFADMAEPSKIIAQTITSPKMKEKGNRILQDVLYPTQEIKPVNTDIPDPVRVSISRAESIEDTIHKTEIGFPTYKSETIDERINYVNRNIIETTNKTEVIEDMTNTEIVMSTTNNKESTVEAAKTDIIEDLINNHTSINTPHVEEEHTNTVVDVVVQETSEAPEMEVTFDKTEEVEDTPAATENIEVTAVEEVVYDKMEEEVVENIEEVVHSRTEQFKEDKMDVAEEIVDEVDTAAPVVKFPETIVQKSYEPYMNESTASAVDALLSVSREADRVTRVISDDPPEDLFEDDHKDNSGTCIENDFNESINVENNRNGVQYSEPEKYLEDKDTPEVNNDLNVITTEVHTEVIEDTVISTEESNVPTINEMDIMTSEQTEIVSSNFVDNVSTCVIDNVTNNVIESIPSESDLQIAETLINLPSTAVQNKTPSDLQTEQLNVPINEEVIEEQLPPSHPPEEMVIEEKPHEIIIEPILHQQKSLLISNNENLIRFETEQEKSENLNAAQSLVQMSESIDHKINIDHSLTSSVNNNKAISDKGLFNVKRNNGLDSMHTVEQKLASMSNDNNSEHKNGKSSKVETSSSRLLKILEEPCTPKFANKSAASKPSIMTGKEKILNFDVAKTSFKNKPESPKQKIIIRRTTPNKHMINNMSEITTPDKIILSRSSNPAQDGSVQTYTIQTTPEAPSDANTIIIQQKIRKIAKPPAKMQKIKPSNSLVPPLNETSKIINDTAADDAMFDINSMPIVLSEDLLTPENIEKMPIVMSDGNIITHTPNPPKLVKTKQTVENEKIAISATPNKSEMKTLLMNPVSDSNKVNTPNILSKSSKLRGAKPMLVIDKTTGKQKIIMTKGESNVKEIKQPPTLIQSVPQTTGKSEKFIILPTPNSPRPGRTQKIVIDPQTGKAHVLVAKGSEPQLTATENKPVSAKLIPSSTETSAPGNTVMIITNAQGAQSRIVLTPEHEKMLFPKKQQPNVSQLKTIAHRISTNPGASQKSLVTTMAHQKTQNVGPVKTQTRIVPKQKSAIITSKGQLIVGGRVATATQNIAPMPEIRPVPKRIMASEPKKLVQTIQKTSSEPLIFLQQKSGAVMQLTAAQFEHLQRTGQIVQRTSAPPLQKTITISPNEAGVPTVHKPRVRKAICESPAPAKKMKQEIAIAPAPLSHVPPALAPFSNNNSSLVPSVSNTVSVATTNAYPEFENFEELLPSTAIVRQQPEPVAPPPEPVAAPPAGLVDSQLLAVPGEHFGGPCGCFYLCIEDNGTFTPVDNRPLILENNQLVPMPEPVPAAQPERRDILEAALANSDVFHADSARDEAPDFRDLNANVSVHCRVSETSTTLNQPIMTPVEVPSKVDSEPTVPSNLEDGLAVIGVTPPTVPTSLELPITVTDPRIAPAKTTDPLSNNNYGAGVSLLPSPNTEMTYVTTDDVPMTGPISMPLLTEEESVGKSMPILTDDITERTVSSVDSTVGSPSSIDVRESETEEGGQWSRRLLTPGSDTSEASAEIPLQPAIQLSVSELSRHS